MRFRFKSLIEMLELAQERFEFSVEEEELELSSFLSSRASFEEDSSLGPGAAASTAPGCAAGAASGACAELSDSVASWSSSPCPASRLGSVCGAATPPCQGDLSFQEASL